MVKNDLESLKQTIFNHYHTLSVEILNAENNEIKSMLQQTQNTILKYARQIQFEDELKSYIPIVYNTKDFEEQYDNAFYDILEKEFDKMKNTLQFLFQFFQIFLKEKEKQEFNTIMDIDFIEQQYNHDCFTPNDFNTIISVMYDQMKKIQSPQHDESLDTFKRQLTENISIIQHLRNIFQWFIIDLEILNKKNEN